MNDSAKEQISTIVTLYPRDENGFPLNYEAISYNSIKLLRDFALNVYALSGKFIKSLPFEPCSISSAYQAKITNKVSQMAKEFGTFRLEVVHKKLDNANIKSSVFFDPKRALP